MPTISPWTVTGVSLAAGLLVGLGSAALEARLRPWLVGDFAPSLAENASTPKIEVPVTRHDFGQVAAGEKGQHVFTIRNAGPMPLELSPGAASCSCTVSDLAHDSPRVVPPGGTTTVSVHWTAKGAGEPFRQQVSVLTNDPRRPEIAFVIEGDVVPKWKAIPDRLVIPKFSSTSTASTSLKMITYGATAPRVETLETLDERTRDFFSLSSTALATEDISRETGANGGFLIEVAVKPGLPVGPLRQTVRVVFRVPEEITVEIPIEGEVVGDFSFGGQAWDASRQRIVLGQISGQTGMKTRVFLTARGPKRGLVKPGVEEVVPPWLEVTVGAAEPIGTGAAVRIPIDVSIPPGSPPANHLGSEQAPAGRIVLRTGLPDTPTVSVPVSVVVGP